MPVRPLTHTSEGWPLAKRGDEIVWRGVRWRVVDINGDELLIKAFALTKHLSRKIVKNAEAKGWRMIEGTGHYEDR